MSSRIVVKTVKFCTSSLGTLCSAMDLLNIKHECRENVVVAENQEIIVSGEMLYMNIASDNSIGQSLFNKVNGKVAELERQLRVQRLKENAIEQQKAKEEEERFRLRQLKREEEQLEYQERQLSLERQSFIEAKKQAIIIKAKEKGYSVQEEAVDGKIKLKLVRRIY